jgi:nucleotide-binding universal stress UspA family protein
MLLDIANCLLRCYGGSATVLSVVQVPEGRSLSEGALVVRRKRALVSKIAQSQGGGESIPTFGQHIRWRGIREAVARTEASLLLLNWNATRRPGSLSALESLAGDPPCDLAVVKRGDANEVTTVLVPARGGPQAQLALHLAEAIATEKGAVLTLLHVNVSHWNERRRAREERFFQAILGQVRYENVRHVQIDGDSAEAVLLDEGTRHDMVVMGAAARDETSPYLFGRLPTSMARSLPGCVVIVKTREPVTSNTFKASAESSSTSDQSDL